MRNLWRIIVRFEIRTQVEESLEKELERTPFLNKKEKESPCLFRNRQKRGCRAFFVV